MRPLLLAALLVFAMGCGERAHGIGSTMDPGDDGGSPRTVHSDGGARGAGDAALPPGSDTGAGEPPPSRPLVDVSFVDATEEAGLDHVQAEVGTQLGCDTVPSRCPFTGIHMSGGAATGDYDGDGFPDLLVTRLDQPPVLYKNRGDGTFEDVSEAAGVAFGEGTNGAGFADLDNDGDPDLYLTSVFADRYYLFMNLGDGTFSEQALVRGAAVETPHSHKGFSVSFGDYDRDGYLDLHTTEWVQLAEDSTTPSHARLLRNRGASAPAFFEDATDFAGVDLLAGVRASRTTFTSTFTDLDEDGWPDLAVVGDFVTSRLFWNNGDGSFSDGTSFSRVGTDQNGMGSAFGDYDGDGLIDWFISAIFDPEDRCAGSGDCGWGTTGNRLFRNRGDRIFEDVTDEAGVRDGAWGWGAAFLDYDNDGDLDLTHTNGVDFPNDEASVFRADRQRFWQNDGAGGFEPVAAMLGVDVEDDGRGLLVFDYDVDGDQDLFIANHEGKPRLFRNEGGHENGFLRVRLIGTRDNREGIGARVYLQRYSNDVPQVREVRSGSQFLGQSEREAHFGLAGHEGPLHRVSVRWPDGELVHLRDVAPDQLLVIEQ